MISAEYPSPSSSVSSSSAGGCDPYEQQQQHKYQQRMKREASIALSKTVLSAKIPTYLPAFIATMTYSVWHDADFQSISVAPPTALKQFISFTHSVIKTTGLNFSVVLLALKYVARLKDLCPHLKGAQGSECRLMIVTLMLAMKQLMDNTYSNKTWSKVARIPLYEINLTELEFLNQLNFDLYVHEEDYFEWVDLIEKRVAMFRSWTEVAPARRVRSVSAPHERVPGEMPSPPHQRLDHQKPVIVASQPFVNTQQKYVDPSQLPYPSPAASPSPVDFNRIRTSSTSQAMEYSHQAYKRVVLRH